MQISSQFDSGNIEVVEIADHDTARLRIKKDAGDQHMQWFHFRVSGAKDRACTFVIENASDASYPNAWNGYEAVASYDREHWFRVETRFDGALSISHVPECDTVWYAYFAPYSFERHLDLIAEACSSECVRGKVLGQTLDGRDLDMLQIGTHDDDKRIIWVIGRQHPGETMAEWWMEGFIDRLLDPDDGLSSALLEQAVFYVVPNMNPDGGVRGHLRCNAIGANLNREWHAPTLTRSPEVYHTLTAMDELGCDMCLDVHGDEELPYNFIAGAEGIPSWTPKMQSLQDQFCDAFQRANPDFQREFGYPVDKPGDANMSMCTNQIAERFDCLAMTLEQPFKDTANRPHAEDGWSPERARNLGRSSIDGIAAVVAHLR